MKPIMSLRYRLTFSIFASRRITSLLSLQYHVNINHNTINSAFIHRYYRTASKPLLPLKSKIINKTQNENIIMATSSNVSIDNFNESTKPVLSIAIVGKPNTGKSTLFNRLTRSKQAIISSVPGTTRDRNFGKGSLGGLPLDIVDTGGYDDRGIVTDNIKQQVEVAIRDANVIIFMIDAKTGINSIDEMFAQWLRKKLGEQKGPQEIKSQIIVVANKTEGAHLSVRVLDTLSDAYRLGLGDPIPISAIHGEGLTDLAEQLLSIASSRNFQLLADTPNEFDEPIKLEERKIQIAIMGRPNVGKSSLLNAILGEDRVITGPTAGLTRDAIHVEWKFNNRSFRLVDTAGLTRVRPNAIELEVDDKDKKIDVQRNQIGKSKDESRIKFTKRKKMKLILPGIQYLDPEEDPSQFSGKISELALISALNALKFAQVVFLVIESNQGRFSKIDLQLAQKCLQEGRALIVIANKRDLLALGGISGREYESTVKQHCEQYLREFGDVLVISCSATEKEGIQRILKTAISVHDSWSRRIPTANLNRWLKDLLVTSPVVREGVKVVTIKYITQVKARPPTFALFCNVSSFPQSYERFLRSRLQHDFNLQGIPIRFMIRKAKGTEVNKKLLKQGTSIRRNIHQNRSRGVGPKNRDRGTNLYITRKKRLEARKDQKRFKSKIQKTSKRQQYK